MLTRPGEGGNSGFHYAAATLREAGLPRSHKSQDLSGFHTDTIGVCVWLARLVKVFCRVQPRTTAFIVAATVLANFASLAAFLLPLKVLLLAGSGSGQTYFGTILSPDAKMRWIFGLSIAAVSLYFLTRLLRAYTKKMAGEGSNAVMQRANQLELLGNQDAVGRRHFSRITRICADLITAGMAFTAIALFDPAFVTCLMALFAAQYGLTELILGDGGRFTNQLAKRIREEPGDYIDNIHTVSFWLAFLIILVQFLIGGGGNILVAVLSLVLVRLALKHFASAANSIVALAGNRGLIDALMFPTHRWRPAERQVRRDFHSLFEHRAHIAKLETVLAGHDDMPRPIAVRWKDSPISGYSTFVLGFGPDGPLYLEQVFAPHQAHLIKNEDVLFTHISRDLLNAPTVRYKFMHGSFQCRVCDYGLGFPESATAWNLRLTELLEQVWSIKPPDQLVQLFRASHAFFYERLTPEFLDKLWLAVDDEEQAETVRALHAALPFIRAALSEMPLCVSNRDMTRSNTAVRADGRVFIMSWGRWSVQPLGVDLPPSPTPETLAAIIAQLRERRPDIPGTLGPDCLLLVAACSQLETLIRQEHFEAALRVLPTILKYSSVLDEESTNAPTEVAPATTAVDIMRATELRPAFALPLAV